MRRFFVIAMALVLMVCLLAGAASAETCANSVKIYATVSSDEACQVTVTALLHLEQASGTVYFPVPAEAESVTLNGTRVTTTRTSSGRQVDLSGILGNLVGDFSVTITYVLRDVVAYNENEILQLQLPLLAGFAYPVENLEYSITLPGAVPAKPAFSSGYHKANIEQDLQTQQNGAMISGKATKTLKDHETLEMTLLVSEEMFPQNKIELPDFEFTKTFMWIFVALAVLYWAIFLRCGIPRRSTSAAAPEGFSAGQIGSVLHMQGADLTAMVFTWAQLGYLFIGKGKGRNILLYKQMDMGNERSSFEQKCFRSLFGRRNVVDTGELHYVEQWQKINRANPGIQDLIHPKTGNKKIFRALAAGVGLFCGIGVGITLTAGAGLQWLWVILLALAGFLVSWHIHRWAESLFLRQKKHLWVAVVLSVLWLALSILAGVAPMGIWTILFQFLAGLFCAFGGRRTPAGMQASSEVLGLRRYLRKLSKEDLQRICRNNPEYFFSVAPYAVALGVDKRFSKLFGKEQLPDCPYMDLGSEAKLTAFGWSERFRQVADVMDRRRKKMWLERITGAVRSFKR